MSEKTVHIVFQVLNFLHDVSLHPYKLLPIDKLLLITLASHKGLKGIFPMQETLAEELGMTRRHLRNRLKCLEKHGLILIEKSGRKHIYHLQNLCQKEELQFPNQQTIEEPQFPSQRNYSSSHRGTTVARNNKLNNKVNNRERAHSVFEPDQGNVILAKDLRLDLSVELESFAQRHKGAKTQYEFARWMKASKEYQATKGGGVHEVRSTVPEWGPGHPAYDERHKVFKPNGVTSNGLQVAGINNRGNGSLKN
jgi:biotin operon repressor